MICDAEKAFYMICSSASDSSTAVVPALSVRCAIIRAPGTGIKPIPGSRHAPGISASGNKGIFYYFPILKIKKVMLTAKSFADQIRMQK
jgi:hypothetical protein